ncbi:TonB-dependent receptor [Sphingomonas sp. MG17]|uniref:TonB-dependent receptor n=1 Tax=Sphingomonas tagetis TaxID=2949092 RepID=A0A9X2HPH1_9SPHN|nr:TonB-dependent receptor [Sphingomonas tagetis]MCP3731118.1 TonB-dependent receptor [Sphingomonas tagetis]
MTQRTLAAVLATQLLASAAWAHAGQETPAGAASGDAAQTSSDDIVVTAQKRSERLQDVPIAVSVATTEQLENSGIKDMQSLNAVVPGLNIATTIGTFIPSLRGIAAGSNVVENAVALYIDGVYLPNQRDGLRDLPDVEQVTVLKGPQGTLFGRNATAGVIQITTLQPSDTPKLMGKIGYESYDTVRASAYVSGGLGEGVAASLSGSYTTQGRGWGKSLSAGFDIYRLEHAASLRGKLVFTPGSRTEITLIGDYVNRRDSGANYQPYPGTTFAYPGFGPTTSRYQSYAGTPGWSSFEGWGASLEIDHDLDFAKFVSISAYRKGDGGFRFDFTNVAAPLIISTGEVPNESYSQELQLISPSGGAFQWVAGVFYFHNSLAYRNFERAFTGIFAPLPTSNRTVVSNTEEVAESFAPFAQVDIKLGDATTLTLGGRWTYEKRTISGGDTITRYNGTTLFVPAQANNTLTIKRPTWRAALNHQFSPDVSAYVSYNRGIKSGGFNIATASTPAYLPETLDDWEAGLKTQLFDNRLIFNVGAFYYSYQNLQVTTFIAGLSPTVTNGARARLYGIDVDFNARVSDQLTLRGGLELMKAEFSSYPNASISTPRATGGALIVPGSATGNRLPLSQEFVGTIAADYKVPIGDVNTLFNVTATYNGDYYLEADNYVRQPAYVMLNASVRISDPSDHVSLTLAVNNLLDESVIARNITNANAYLVNYGFAPRVYSATLGFKF